MLEANETLPRLSDNRPSTPLWVGLTAIGICIGDFCAFKFALKPLLVNSVLLLLPVTLLALDWRRRRALLNSVRERLNHSESQFLMDFVEDRADPRVVRAVYDTMQDYLKALRPNFPLGASDKLSVLLLEDAVEAEHALLRQISRRTGRSLDHATENPYFHQVRSMRDLTLFFNAQPRA